MTGYLEYITAETERIVVNTSTLYREFGGDDTPADVVDLFRKMAKLAK